ncbi:MAG: hypothetical protein COV38_06870 [Bdellovibrionales bacterium CG11_big_fil_rev_8_21_14_0_20_38_13]|nr:MAG: hypothetical protein COW79_08890 [Bdellovibrionales bacterium CG22_combo_CG10-13_8_21_14_all_38_13]PIR30175.1 MAG: hypothetical protein COV38_06870 [Bdellovibrionales bacterium CG11_big_fil_rev_8_21_14_0_20_38_13]
MKKDSKNNKKVIYYLDDSVFLLETFSFVAEMYDCEVVTYNDPFKFLKEIKVESHHEQILLVDFDFKLPDIDGIKLLEEISLDDYAGFSSIYLFTGHELDQDIIQRLRPFDSSRVSYLKKNNENFILLLEQRLGLHSRDMAE